MKIYLLMPIIAVFINFIIHALSQTVTNSYDNAENLTLRNTINYLQNHSARRTKPGSESIKTETDLTFVKQPVKIYANPTSGYLEVEL